MANPVYANTEDRIRKSSIVDDETGCWRWIRYIEPLGYGRIKIGGRRGVVRYAHRISYEAFVGPVPEGMELDHICRNRRCVNPAHLEPVTHEENCRRAREAQAA